jgi:hypothetical protein
MLYTAVVEEVAVSPCPTAQGQTCGCYRKREKAKSASGSDEDEEQDIGASGELPGYISILFTAHEFLGRYVKFLEMAKFQLPPPNVYYFLQSVVV